MIVSIMFNMLNLSADFMQLFLAFIAFIVGTVFAASIAFMAVMARETVRHIWEKLVM